MKDYFDLSKRDKAGPVLFVPKQVILSLVEGCSRNAMQYCFMLTWVWIWVSILVNLPALNAWTFWKFVQKLSSWISNKEEGLFAWSRPTSSRNVQVTPTEVQKKKNHVQFFPSNQAGRSTHERCCVISTGLRIVWEFGLSTSKLIRRYLYTLPNLQSTPRSKPQFSHWTKFSVPNKSAPIWCSTGTQTLHYTL